MSRSIPGILWAAALASCDGGGSIGGVVTSRVNFDRDLAALRAGGRSDWRQKEGLLPSLLDGVSR
jgi:hypothetical protein